MINSLQQSSFFLHFALDLAAYLLYTCARMVRNEWTDGDRRSKAKAENGIALQRYLQRLPISDKVFLSPFPQFAPVQVLWLRLAALRLAGLPCNMSGSLRSAKMLPRMARISRIRVVWSETISNP
jgi:hypothetical protein